MEYGDDLRASCLLILDYYRVSSFFIFWFGGGGCILCIMCIRACLHWYNCMHVYIQMYTQDGRLASSLHFFAGISLFFSSPPSHCFSSFWRGGGWQGERMDGWREMRRDI